MIDKMRIGIDFHSAEDEGSGNCVYIRNLVDGLIQKSQEDEFFLYVTDRTHNYYKRFEDVNNVHLCSIGSTNFLIRFIVLGIKTFINKIDLLFVQYAAPFVYRGKLVVTVHDISFIHFPNCFNKLELFYHNILIPINIKRAYKVLTVSEFSRQDIIKHYLVPDNKVKAISNGVNRIFKSMPDLEKARAVLNGYNIFGKFILFVGRINSRKNVIALIKAFNNLKNSSKISHKLIIIGKNDFLSEVIKNEIKNCLHKNEIIMLGYVLEEHLPSFYNLADLFVYPSLYEGFGLPVLEAMSCGCPVITSKNSSLPEVAGAAGILIDPLNVEELANAMMKVINNSEFRKDMVKKGIEHAGKFSWEKAAQETLEVFRSYC
jgi:glycosyltransferase involved in cell wall biosynthesis